MRSKPGSKIYTLRVMKKVFQTHFLATSASLVAAAFWAFFSLTYWERSFSYLAVFSLVALKRLTFSFLIARFLRRRFSVMRRWILGAFQKVLSLRFNSRCTT